MSEWSQGTNVTPRVVAITTLATALDNADSEYLAGTIDRDAWVAKLREIEEKLTVAGLRLAVRPWAPR